MGVYSDILSVVYTRWQDRTPGQAIRDLAIYQKQILEGILESLYGHPGFSNLRKADPWRVFWILHWAIRDFAIYEKQVVVGYLGVSIKPSGF